MRRRIILWLAGSLSAGLQTSNAEIVATEKVYLSSACHSMQGVAVIAGHRLPSLLGTPLQQISLHTYSQGTLAPLIFQIDPKDSRGRYHIQATPTDQNQPDAAVLDKNDELVLRLRDSGQKIPPASEFVSLNTLVEIQLVDAESGITGWIYASSGNRRRPLPSDRFISYLPATDSVRSDLYFIGFSRQMPFLIDSFHWNLGKDQGRSPDISDTMKIRHRGLFLGFLPFERTQDDYSSKLVAVKAGPLRVIRRTSNRIRMLWTLKTPRLYVDYVMMTDGFIMDTVIDVPFNIGLFFSNIETLTTVDWNDDPQLPKLTIHAPDGVTSLAVDGRMSADERVFNTVNARQFAVSSSFGRLSVRLEMADDFPIRPWLFLRDDSTQADPPENRSGQFGNVGFRTTEWERIDSGEHHLTFRVCMYAPS